MLISCHKDIILTIWNNLGHIEAFTLISYQNGIIITILNLKRKKLNRS